MMCKQQIEGRWATCDVKIPLQQVKRSSSPTLTTLHESACVALQNMYWMALCIQWKK
jgi:hypothetical protein